MHTSRLLTSFDIGTTYAVPETMLQVRSQSRERQLFCAYTYSAWSTMNLVLCFSDIDEYIPSPGPPHHNGTEGYVTSFSIQYFMDIGGSTSNRIFHCTLRHQPKHAKFIIYLPGFRKTISTIDGLCANLVNRLLSLTYGCALSFIYGYETWAFYTKQPSRGCQFLNRPTYHN